MYISYYVLLIVLLSFFNVFTETIRVRLATTERIGVTNLIKNLLKAEGPSGLFRGVGPAMLAFIPYAGIDLALFDSLKTMYVQSGNDREPTPVVIMLCAGTSATAGQTVAYPISLIRTKIQADGKDGSPLKYSGMSDCLRKVWQQEKFPGLYRGFGINFFKSVPSIAVSYAVGDYVRRTASAVFLSNPK